MRSEASFRGHPVHPMLIVYPFAFLTGAFAFNAAGVATKHREWRIVADHLVPAGIAAGLLAAIPGIIDYLNSVPPGSSAKTRATKHALLNVSGLALFATSWLLGRGDRRTGLPLAIQGLATAAMSVAGWLGGTLVVRNQIGVDHRYAGAGKWQEATRELADARALTSAAGGLDVNQMKLVHVDDERIVVARTEQGYVAFQDRCTHKGGPLSDGVLICGTVQCPWHGSQFDVCTGAVKSGPAERPITIYPIDGPHEIRRA
jgi:nitrite reductase/ring-hydroxylating ferredoxin subunit/uncharacterized membrane protein